MRLAGFLLVDMGALFLLVPLIWNLAAALAHRPDRAVGEDGPAVIGFLLGTAGYILIPSWPWAIAWGVMLIFRATWWWRRRKKRRALAALGNKARARIEAMKQAMRERAQPRPVLKPGWQGAR